VAKNVLGLDIDSKYIKMAFIRQGKTDTVLKTIYAATPTDSVVNGEIKNIDVVAARIRSVLFDYKFKPAELYISINSQNVVVREIKLPMLKEKEIDPAIEFELMQSFPGIVQSHTISSKIYSAPGMPVEGITAFCPNRVLADYAEVAKGLLIPLKGIDINANALTKAVKLFMPQEYKKETYIVVDVGFTMCQVNLVSADKLLLSRQISSGIVRFDNLVANRIGMSIDQAERARQNNKYDIYNLDKEDVDGFIKIAFSEVDNQIRQIIDYYKYNKSDETKITSILLFAGRGLDTSLSDYFGGKFNLPVNTIKPIIKEPSVDNTDAMAMAAIGAALSPITGSKDINLMPKLKEMREAGLKRIKLTRALAVVLVLTVLGLGAFTYFKLMTSLVTNQTNAIQNDIIRYSVINETKEKLRVSQNHLESAKSILESHDAELVLNTEVFDHIGSCMPGAIFINSYNINNEGDIVINGVALDRKSVSDFVYNLKQSDLLERVAVSNIISRSETAIDYDFTIEITLDKAKAGE
jgi:type IV pilus assembly protein PilM